MKIQLQMFMAMRMRDVHDCHAEILARRGLLHYFYDSISVVLDHVEAGTLDQLPDDVIFTYNPPTNATNTSDSDCDVFQCFVLKPQYSVHFYTSSQPCGNASWKNWGKSKTTVLSPSASAPMALAIPTIPHPLFHCSAVEEGQVECLVKRDHSYNYTGGGDVDMNQSHAQLKVPPVGTSYPFPVQVSVPVVCGASTSNPSGDQDRDGITNTGVTTTSTVPTPSPSTSTGVIMTCSDKISKWCNVGVQGGLLSYLLCTSTSSGTGGAVSRSGIYLDTITVGRKYSEVHLQRALCCRTRGFQFNSGGTASSPNPNPGATSYCVHHPTTLCTSVKFDTGVIVTGTGADGGDVTGTGIGEESIGVGANFSEPRCVVYWKPVHRHHHSNPIPIFTPYPTCEVIDGTTGLLSEPDSNPNPNPSSSSISQVAPVSFLKQFAVIWSRLSGLHTTPCTGTGDIGGDTGLGSGSDQLGMDLSLNSYMALKRSTSIPSLNPNPDPDPFNTTDTATAVGTDTSLSTTTTITNAYWLAKEELCYSNRRSAGQEAAAAIGTDTALELEMNGNGKMSKIPRISTGTNTPTIASTGRGRGRSYKSIQKKCVQLNVYISVKKQIAQLQS